MGKPTYSPSALPYKIQAKIRVDGCWLWTGVIAKDGYGKVIWPPVGVNRGGRKWQAHRLVYELLVGPIPDRLVLDHLCKVRHCVNPAHLEPVTLAENSRRAYSGGRPNTNGLCRNGKHPWTPPNIHIQPDGKPRCRECQLEKSRKQKAAGRQRRAQPGKGQGSLLN